MRLTAEQRRTFDEDGYLLVRGAVPLEPIRALMRFVAHVVRLESGSDAPDAELLNRGLTELKKAHPSSSSWIYQTILTSWALKRFFVDIGIEGMAMELLGIENPNNLGLVSPAFRFDIPGDTRNVRAWHQDSAYFQENALGNEHLVAWIPTTPARRENGSVIMIPGSHRGGKHRSDHVEADGFASEQYVAPRDRIDGRPMVHIEAEPGDVAFINMDLIHASGTNSTADDVRYTAQIRFNTINRDGYRPVQLKPTYPRYARSGR